MKGLKRLGIDEIALRKGQDNFVVVFVDLDTREFIGFAESRQQKDTRKVIEGWGLAVRSQITEVSIDLSGNYKGLGQKLLPNAEIVADRFHVMKLVNQDLNSARNAVTKANETNPNSSVQKQIETALKQSKYALLKPEENLTDKQRLKLEEVKAASPLLAQLHQQKESFRTIFETAENWESGTWQLLDWLADAQESFRKSVGTICRWFGEITGYFEHRTTSGSFGMNIAIICRVCNIEESITFYCNDSPPETPTTNAECRRTTRIRAD